MTLAIVVCGLLAAASVVIAVLLFRGADNLLGEVEPRATWDVDSDPGVPVVVSRVSVPSLPETRIRLVSNGGRLLGETSITTRRRVTLQQRVGKARELSNFVASHKDGDVWVYRRVGVEKE
jgi:hypothetical protein